MKMFLVLQEGVVVLVSSCSIAFDYDNYIGLITASGRRKREVPSSVAGKFKYFIQGDRTGCCTGNGEKLSSSQAEPGLVIKSAVP